MAVISFVRASSAGSPSVSPVNATARPQRARLKQVGPDSPGREFSFPFGPQGVAFTEYGLDYNTTNRPGEKAILTATGKKLRKLKVSAVLADKNSSGKASIESQISTFLLLAEEPYDCAFTYGVVTLPFRVRVTSVEYTSVRRDLDGNITQAKAEFELTEVVQVNQSIVSLSAITYDPPPAPKTVTKKPGKKPDSGGGSEDKNPEYEPDDPKKYQVGTGHHLRYAY